MKAEILKGDGGIFDVEADGRMVFSKHQVDRFPNDEEEVLSALRDRT